MLKVEIISQPDKTHPGYPYLGEYGYGDHRKVVLFVKQGAGTVVFTAEGSFNHSLGDYSENWIEANFEPCRDKVVLVNN